MMVGAVADSRVRISVRVLACSSEFQTTAKIKHRQTPRVAIRAYKDVGGR